MNEVPVVLGRRPRPPALSEARLRINMLLLDAIDRAHYVFDPETADIAWIPEQVAFAVRLVQAGEPEADKVAEALVRILELPPAFGQPHTERAGEWAMTLHLNHACNLACTYCYADGRTSDDVGTA